MYFKWNADKVTGRVEVESGYYGARKVIGTVAREISGQLSACIMLGDKTKTLTATSAKKLKERIVFQRDKFNGEMVTVINMVSNKEVQISRDAVGGVSDPSTELYHSF